MVRRKTDFGQERHWQGIVEGWQASGLSQAEYCRREGVNERHFYAWRKRVENRQGSKPAPAKPKPVATENADKHQPRFLPVEIKPLSPEPVVVKQGTSHLEIVTPGGYVVRIP